MPKCPAWVLTSVVLTAVVSLVGVAARHQVEARNRAVGLLMEASTIKGAASVASQNLSEVLGRLRSAGLTGVALSAEKVGDLVARGSLTVKRGPDDPDWITVLVHDPVDGVRALRAVERSLGGRAERVFVPDGAAFRFKGDVAVMLDAPIGIDPRDADRVTSAGLVLVARHENSLGFGPAQIRDVLDESKQAGASAYLPAGDQVLGQRKCVEDTAIALKDLGMQLLVPEFVRIGGSTQLASFLPESTLRLHSVQQAEVDRLEPAALSERFGKAFRERNVRWLLVRPVSYGTPDPVASLQGALALARGAVVKEGGGVKPPRPFERPKAPDWAPWLVGLSAAPALGWLAWVLAGPARRAGFVAAALGAAAALLTGPEPTRLWGALALATALPVLGFAWLLGQERVNPATGYLVVSGFSLCGGLAVAGTLVGLPFMLQIEQFLGVKVTLFIPLALVAHLLLRRAGGWRSVAEGTVRWGPLVASACILAAVGLMLVRAGNDAPGAVSGIELKLRSLLEGALQTRPRTKEFLVGHPALFVGLAALASGSIRWAGWAPVLLLVGAIGQTSIVNTLCHLHTPVEVGVTRIVIGLALGGILGATVWALAGRGARRPA